MTRKVSADKIEDIVGARRHGTKHIGRAVSSEQTVYILHPQSCVDSGIDLRKCEMSIALDRGIDLSIWEGLEDQPVELEIDSEFEDLIPVRRYEEP